MNDTQTIFMALKKLLKVRKISYKDLAERLKMSEANVKRIFSEETCSLHRLVEICNVIPVSLSELIRSASEMAPDFFTLSKDVEDFFADHLDYFVMYRLLERDTDLKDIQQANGLSHQDMNRYLKKLEQFGLIQVQPRDRVKIMNKGYLRLAENSRLKDRYFRRWIPKFFLVLLEPHEKHFVKVFSTGLSERNRQELVRDLEDLANKYRERGYFDQTKGVSEFESVGICIGLGPYRVGEDRVQDYLKS